MIERPDGVKIGACFILAISSVSLLSRIERVFELRATEIDFDATGQIFVRDCARRTIRLVANEPDHRDAEEYVDKLRQIAARPRPARPTPTSIFVEVTVVDPSRLRGPRSTCTARCCTAATG